MLPAHGFATPDESHRQADYETLTTFPECWTTGRARTS